MEPNFRSERAPDADQEWRENLRRYENRMHPHYDLTFDGRKLVLRENGKPVLDRPAVSGRPRMQGGEYQSYRDHGPLPQGRYRFRVGEMQRYDDLDVAQKLAGLVGGGQWRGGTRAWGNYRFWLTPSKDTQSYGRGNFSIHGGAVPGSAGCIDLTDAMAGFADLMQAVGQDEIDVRVDYGWDGLPNHRHKRARRGDW